MEDERVRSVIWNYFDRRKINDTIFGFCKIGKCSQKISCPTSSTTGLFTHLRSYHKKESAECDKKAQEAKRMKKVENKAGKQLSVSVTDLWAKKTAWTSDHEKAKEITRAIGRMLASDYLPYDFVEGQGFQALMKLVVPQYHIPSRTTFSRSIVPTMYKNLKREMIDRITTEFVGMPSYCFSTDIWSSRALDSYLSFCLIYLTADFQMRSYTLENKPFVGMSHTGEAILESLEKSIEDWSLPRAVPIYVLRDNGSNMRAAMNMSQKFMDLPCFVHTLQLSINDAVSEIEGMISMIATNVKKSSRTTITVLNHLNCCMHNKDN